MILKLLVVNHSCTYFQKRTWCTDMSFKLKSSLFESMPTYNWFFYMPHKYFLYLCSIAGKIYCWKNLSRFYNILCFSSRIVVIITECTSSSLVLYQTFTAASCNCRFIMAFLGFSSASENSGQWSSDKETAWTSPFPTYFSFRNVKHVVIQTCFTDDTALIRSQTLSNSFSGSGWCKFPLSKNAV